MLSIKIFNKKENRNQEFTKTVNNIISYIFNKLNINNSRVISDNSSIEITSGKEIRAKTDDIILELVIRKFIIINNEEFNDKQKLDKHITEIKYFCDQAKNIEDLKYLPLTMR